MLKSFFINYKKMNHFYYLTYILLKYFLLCKGSPLYHYIGRHCFGSGWQWFHQRCSHTYCSWGNCKTLADTDRNVSLQSLPNKCSFRYPDHSSVEGILGDCSHIAEKVIETWLLDPILDLNIPNYYEYLWYKR